MTLKDLNDFQQKRYNRPIDITDIAISKVRRTRFDGFSVIQEEFVQECHKELLREAQKLNKINKTNKMEVGVLIDIHKWEKWVIHGTECEVEMKNNPIALNILLSSRKNQLMFMHNHPSTGTFSGADLKYFCDKESLYMMTVVGNDGTVYSLTKMVDFDIRVLAEYMRLANDYYNKGYVHNNGTLAIKDILKRANEFGLKYKKGSRK